MAERPERMPIEQPSDSELLDSLDSMEEDLERTVQEQTDRAQDEIRRTEEAAKQASEDVEGAKKQLKRAREIAAVRETKEMREKGQKTGSVGGTLAYPAVRAVDKFAGFAVKEPQRWLSSIFTGLENFGTNLIKKNAPWVKYIPYAGPWLLKKAEKNLREREKEAEKKREAAAKKKKKTKKADKALEDDLKKAKGDPKKIAKAVKKHRESSSDDKKDEKKKDEEKSDDSSEEKKEAA